MDSLPVPTNQTPILAQSRIDGAAGSHSYTPVWVNKSAKLPPSIMHVNSTVLHRWKPPPSGAVVSAFVDLFLFNAKLSEMIYLDPESAATEGKRLCYWETVDYNW